MNRNLKITRIRSNMLSKAKMRVEANMSRRSLCKMAASLFLCLTIGVPAVQAQHAGAFSRTGFGARGISMGNALAADIFSGTSPYYNPAHAPHQAGQSIRMSVSSMSFDRSQQVLQLGAPLQQRAGFALGIIHASVSDIDGRDNSGFHTGKLSVDEYAGFLAFGLRLSDRVSAGINLQMFRTDLFEGLTPAQTIGADLGVAVRLRPGWAVALVLDDMLARYSWDSGDIGGSGSNIQENFPRRLRLGLANQRLNDRLLLSLEVENRMISRNVYTYEPRILGDSPARVREESELTLRETRLRLGGEYLPATDFAIRAGIEQLGSDVLDSVRPSAGFSAEQLIGQLRLRFDYAFAMEWQASGRVHILGLQLFL